MNQTSLTSPHKIAAIMQPTYIPWAGYFNLIANSNVFVFLDDVQFERRSWQSRNRILVNSEPYLLTVPVHSNRRDMLISEILIDNEQKWRKKHCEIIKQTYSKHPYFDDVKPILNIMTDDSILGLADLNVTVIKYCAQHLDLNTEFKRAQDIGVKGKRSTHLLNICLALDCDHYLSPVGSMDYLKEDGIFANSPVNLMFQDYTPQAYNQPKNDVFISHLSIVDVVANLGWKAARGYIL